MSLAVSMLASSEVRDKAKRRKTAATHSFLFDKSKEGVLPRSGMKRCLGSASGGDAVR